jgi:hypothetical protein
MFGTAGNIGRFLTSVALPDPTTFSGFTAQYLKPDYDQGTGTNDNWVPRATTLGGSAPRLVNGGSGRPSSSGGEPLFVGPNPPPFDFLLSTTATFADYFGTSGGFTCVVGFQATGTRASDNIGYDGPAVFTEAGGYWGITYTTRVEVWHYPGSYTPGIVLPLAINTPTIVVARYMPSLAAANRMQARRMKDVWTPNGSDPGYPSSTGGQMLMGMNYAEAVGFQGNVRFLLTYKQPLSDSDCDKCVDWAVGTWPGYFS